MNANSMNMVGEKRGRKLHDFGCGPVLWNGTKVTVVRRGSTVTIGINRKAAIVGNWISNKLEVTDLRKSMQMRYGTDELEELALIIEDLIQQLDLMHDETLRGEVN